MEGDDHGEAYTVIVWGVGLSHEILEIAGAEAVATAEGNMCGAVMRGTVALPGSEATSRTNGSARSRLSDPGPRQEVEETKLSRNRRGVGRLRSTAEASNKAD